MIERRGRSKKRFLVLYLYTPWDPRGPHHNSILRPCLSCSGAARDPLWHQTETWTEYRNWSSALQFRLVLWAQIKASIATSEARQGLGSVWPTRKQRKTLLIWGLEESLRKMYTLHDPLSFASQCCSICVLPLSYQDLERTGLARSSPGLAEVCLSTKEPHDHLRLTVHTLKSSLASHTDNQSSFFWDTDPFWVSGNFWFSGFLEIQVFYIKGVLRK